MSQNITQTTPPTVAPTVALTVGSSVRYQPCHVTRILEMQFSLLPGLKSYFDGLEFDLNLITEAGKAEVNRNTTTQQPRSNAHSARIVDVCRMGIVGGVVQRDCTQTAAVPPYPVEYARWLQEFVESTRNVCCITLALPYRQNHHVYVCLTRAGLASIINALTNFDVMLAHDALVKLISINVVRPRNATFESLQEFQLVFGSRSRTPPVVTKASYMVCFVSQRVADYMRTVPGGIKESKMIFRNYPLTVVMYASGTVAFKGLRGPDHITVAKNMEAKLYSGIDKKMFPDLVMLANIASDPLITGFIGSSRAPAAAAAASGPLIAGFIASSSSPAAAGPALAAPAWSFAAAAGPALAGAASGPLIAGFIGSSGAPALAGAAPVFDRAALMYAAASAGFMGAASGSPAATAATPSASCSDEDPLVSLFKRQRRD